MSISATQWQFFCFLVIFSGLLAASYKDLRYRRVPNWLVGLMAGAGVILNTVFPSLEAGIFTNLPGPLGPWLSLSGFLFALVIFLPLWIFHLLGAADVKLFAAVGAYAGPSAVPDLTLFVFLSGGALALGYMIVWRKGRQVILNTFALFGGAGRDSFGNTNALNQTAWRMPYAVAITGGVASYAWWTLSAHPPILNF